VDIDDVGDDIGDVGDGVASQSQQQKKKKGYIPRLGSANYAFLIVLYRELHGDGNDGRQHLTKKELMDLAEASGLSSKPINSMGGGSERAYGVQASKTYYNGWSNFKALVNNGLVRAWGSPKKIALTDAGVAVARRLNELRNDMTEGPHTSALPVVLPAAGRPVVCDGEIGQDIAFARATSDRGASASTSARSAEIVLLIDTREQYARSIVDKMPGAEIRTLPVGDALWIARNGQEEYVLDYVIERKSIADLMQSVRAGSRYHGQKYRLQQCGIRNLYYLIEGDIESLSSSTDYKLVGTAGAKTSAIDGFNVLRPKSFAGTLALFSRMTRSIRKQVTNSASSGGDDTVTSWARRSGLMTYDEFQTRCVGLEKGSNSAQEVWSVMLNEVPGMGRVAVEGRVFSDPRHRTCHGFYSGMVRGGSGRGAGSEPAGSQRGASQASQVSSKKIESIVNALFYPS
jgi:ERCC4-type nuclease